MAVATPEQPIAMEIGSAWVEDSVDQIELCRYQLGAPRDRGIVDTTTALHNVDIAGEKAPSHKFECSNVRVVVCVVD